MNYTVKVKVTIQDDRTGRPKSHSETYFVEDAVSPTDVEAIITKEFKGSTFDWEITNISVSNIVKVLTAEDRADKFNA